MRVRQEVVPAGSHKPSTSVQFRHPHPIMVTSLDVTHDPRYEPPDARSRRLRPSKQGDHLKEDIMSYDTLHTINLNSLTNSVLGTGVSSSFKTFPQDNL